MAQKFLIRLLIIVPLALSCSPQYRLAEEDLSTKTNQEILAHLMVNAFQQLQDESYHFQLLLPSDRVRLKLSHDEVAALCSYLGTSSVESRKRAGLGVEQSKFITELYRQLLDLTEGVEL